MENKSSQQKCCDLENKHDLSGIFSALLISFDEDGKINEKGTREIIRHNIDKCKVDGLYVGGSTGENFMLNTQEKMRIFEIASEECGGKVKLIAQVGSLDLREAVALATFATKLNYDSLSAITPFYYKFDFSEIKNYYNTITNYADNRMIIYSIPYLTGVNISLDQFDQLFSNHKIIGVKYTMSDFYLLERLRTRYKDKLIYAGSDEMLLSAACLGVDGAIGSTYNVNGAMAKKLFYAAKHMDMNEAFNLQHQTNNFITDVLNNGLYQTLKLLLTYAGVDAGYCRQPMKRATKEMQDGAKEIYQKYFMNK